MCFGILIGETPETTQWVFAVAAGLFIYIALVDMMPELSAPKTKDENFSIIQFVLQLSGMLSGFGAMLLIAIYEEKLETLFTA
ncbi:CLUMA_CG005766, isoform A [Clunio marinus]|uniref:CLUMA_CG005766, isoform A n=1 Tax=Clunio marinus TaxID=568069 RepID=A0A1J1HVW1_9DIPT|nr:CLUMA_CG005766, isoform A [Clunio marinus]